VQSGGGRGTGARGREMGTGKRVAGGEGGERGAESPAGRWLGVRVEGRGRTAHYRKNPCLVGGRGEVSQKKSEEGRSARHVGRCGRRPLSKLLRRDRGRKSLTRRGGCTGPGEPAAEKSAPGVAENVQPGGHSSAGS